jgi:hypothetical protein
MKRGAAAVLRIAPQRTPAWRRRWRCVTFIDLLSLSSSRRVRSSSEARAPRRKRRPRRRPERRRSRAARRARRATTGTPAPWRTSAPRRVARAPSHPSCAEAASTMTATASWTRTTSTATRSSARRGGRPRGLRPAFVPARRGYASRRSMSSRSTGFARWPSKPESSALRTSSGWAYPLTANSCIWSPHARSAFATS